MANVWKPDDRIVWRGVYRARVWHAQTVIVVKDTPQEVIVALLPGTECVAPEGYLKGKQYAQRRWDFKEALWSLEKFHWHTNHLLLLLEPQKYFSTILFWHHESNNFLCYYINFQVPFERSESAINTLDLDLDLIIHPDLSYEWKDVDEYQKAIECGIILPEWIQGIEDAKFEILNKLEKRQYPFDGSWLEWIPNPNWSPPTLPENWDKI
jgi:protein associated with RNAse G/E